jgi:hypothetical protein
MDMDICRLLRRHSLFQLSVVRDLIANDIWNLNEFVDNGEGIMKEILLPALRRRTITILQPKDVDVPLLRARAVLLAASDMKQAKMDLTRRRSVLEIEQEFLNMRPQSV